MHVEFVSALVAAGMIASLAFVAAWLQWRKGRSPDSMQVALCLLGFGVGTLAGPALGALLAVLTGEAAFGEHSVLFSCVGVVLGGATGQYVGTRGGRRGGRPTQQSEDYRDSVPWDEPR